MKNLLRLIVLLLVSASLFANGVAEKPPVLQMQEQPRLFISPGNPYAEVRTLLLPFSTITLTQKGQVIQSWTFSIYDSSGKLVSEDSRLETRDRGFFGELFNIGDRPQVEVPSDLSWDGTFHLPGNALNGGLVPDGNYTYQLTVADSTGKRAQTPPFNVTVKNTALVIDYLRIPQTVFSPSGQRKTILIEQSSSPEKRWKGQILDSSGKVIRTWSWENPAELQLNDVRASTVQWDGKADDGTVVPDGEYTYQVEGQNRARASLTQRFPGTISIDSNSGVVKLGASGRLLSPNGDALLETLDLLPDAGDGRGMVSWTVRVSNVGSPADIRWHRSGKAPLPLKIVFDGRDQVGSPLPDGHYQAELTATYENGDKLGSGTVVLEQSTKPPKASISADYTVFGGTGRAGVNLEVAAESGTAWKLEIFDKIGTQMRTYDLGDSGTGTIEFQGFDEKAHAFADGPFTAKVSGRNKFGSLGIALLQLQKDSRAMTASLELSLALLIPGIGARSTVRVTPILAIVDSIVHTRLTVAGPDGQTVAMREAESIVPFWDWNGKNKAGTTVADGTYDVGVEVSYSNGTVAKAQMALLVDSTAGNDQGPQVDLKLSSKTFAPENIDGPQTLTLSLQATAGSDPLALWKVTVLDPRGRPFQTFSGIGNPPNQLVWDGRAKSGEFVESGEEYQITFSVTDAKKREAQKQTQVTTDILVSNIADGRYKIVISSIQYSGYSSDLFKVAPELLSRNIDVLQKLSAVFKKFPDYTIQLQGYAVSEYWSDPATALTEQRDQLLPLSFDRAEEVRNALVLLGVVGTRFTVDGFGSESPLVPHGDLENRWKNRRVEFYLQKN